MSQRGEEKKGERDKGFTSKKQKEKGKHRHDTLLGPQPPTNRKKGTQDVALTIKSKEDPGERAPSKSKLHELEISASIAQGKRERGGEKGGQLAEKAKGEECGKNSCSFLSSQLRKRGEEKKKGGRW